MSKDNGNYVYFLREQSESGPLKIGTSKDPNGRIKDLKPGNYRPLNIVYQLPGSHKVETELHHMFDTCRIGGEWFSESDKLTRFCDLLDDYNHTPERYNNINGISEVSGSKYKVGHIYQETNYDLFIPSEDNRTPDPRWVQSLVTNMNIDLFNMQPILVQEYKGQYHIKDGQHRYLAAKEMGLPVRFTVGKNISHDIIRDINNGGKPWTLFDYLDYYLRRGYISYLKFKLFWDDNDWLPITRAMHVMLPGKLGSKDIKNFKMGTLPCVPEEHIQDAQSLADKLFDYYTVLEKYHPYKGIKRDVTSINFINALKHLYVHPLYNHGETLKKLKKKPLEFQTHNRHDEYIFMIENVVNKGKRTASRVNLRASY